MKLQPAGFPAHSFPLKYSTSSFPCSNPFQHSRRSLHPGSMKCCTAQCSPATQGIQHRRHPTTSDIPFCWQKRKTTQEAWIKSYVAWIKPRMKQQIRSLRKYKALAGKLLPPFYCCVSVLEDDSTASPSPSSQACTPVG